MSNGQIYPDAQVSVTKLKAEELERHVLKANDIVMARRGELGRCALVNDEQDGWLCGTGSLRVRLRYGFFEPSYLVQLIGSSGVRDSLNLSSVGSTMDNLNSSIVARLRLPIPPLQEQSSIMKWIQKETNDIETIIAMTRKEIDLTLEYRACLFSDVVTGKVDVRNVAERASSELHKPITTNEEGLLEDNGIDDLFQDDLEATVEEGET